MLNVKSQIELLKRADMVPPTCTVPLRLGATTCGPPGMAALATVLERSRRLCLQRYEKDLCREDSYLRYYQRLEVPLTPAQLAVFAGARCAVFPGRCCSAQVWDAASGPPQGIGR